MYRALIDIAQFGNTEIPAKGLSTTVENLKARLSDSKEQCKLELQFEVLKTNMILIFIVGTNIFIHFDCFLFFVFVAENKINH